MKNFRIYQYLWGLCLAERLPGREIWSKLHFLRVKWEMPAVYSKSFLSQLTSTSPVYLQASVASWAGESVKMPSLGLGYNVWFQSHRESEILAFLCLLRGFRQMGCWWENKAWWCSNNFSPVLESTCSLWCCKWLPVEYKPSNKYRPASKEKQNQKHHGELSKLLFGKREPSQVSSVRCFSLKEKQNIPSKTQSLQESMEIRNDFWDLGAWLLLQNPLQKSHT